MSPYYRIGEPPEEQWSTHAVAHLGGELKVGHCETMI
jgi:hypothetical protein